LNWARRNYPRPQMQHQQSQLHSHRRPRAASQDNLATGVLGARHSRARSCAEVSA
jgi:hypothetical protein